MVLPGAVHPPCDTKIPQHQTHQGAKVRDSGGGIPYAVLMTGKAMTIRLSSEQAEMLETVASVSNRPISDVIRAAINSHIDQVASDERFQRGLRERIARAESLLLRPSSRVDD